VTNSASGVSSQPAGDVLSRRQAEIAKLVIRGRSSPQIARELCLSPRTVENHIAALFNKLGVSSRVELTAALLTGGADRRTSRRARTNLPTQRSSLIGRETLVAEIARSLATNRLITLVGAGGMGKTRLALAVGEALLDQTHDGVWLIELGPVSAGSGVYAAVASVFDVRESVNVPLLQTLLGHLEGRSPLIVLDNCEHVIAEAAVLADALLCGCPKVRMLATSRESLRINGEHVVIVPALSVPGPDEAHYLEGAGVVRYPALTLFEQRAQAVDRTFKLTKTNAAAVGAICRQLDGIPLAIELATARMNVLTLAALRARLERSIAFLSSGDRTVQPRHQTLRALIDWSYDLLAPAERRLFERLSVFAGGCDLAAIAAVCADEASEDETLASLASLVEKSLVVADVADREPRYRLLEVTRTYAREKLAERNATALTAQRHANAYAQLAERLERDDGCACDATRPRVLLDIDNWRAALEWTLAGQNDVLLGQRLAAALRPVWWYVSLIEGRRWLYAANALIDERTPRAVQAVLELAQSSIACGLGEPESALAAARRVQDVYRQLGDPTGLAGAQYVAGRALICLMRAEEGESLLRESLESARALGDRKLVGNTLEYIAYARSMAGDLVQARACISEACAVQELVGNRSGAANSRLVLAEAEFRAGNVERACELVEPCVLTLRELGATPFLTAALLNWAAYLIACERWDDARRAASEGLTLARETQGTIWSAWALQHLAAVAALAPNVAASGEGKGERAAQLLGYVDARIAAMASLREFTEQVEYDRSCAALRVALGAEQFARLMAVGATIGELEALDWAAAISS